MSIFEMLKADHRKIAALLDRIKKTAPEDLKKREVLFFKFRRDFTAHAETEERAVYAVLETKTKLHELTLESYEEHYLVDHLLDQLSDLSPVEETWTAKLAVVQELIENHVKEEEGDLFKKMKATLSKEELDVIAKEFRRRKKERHLFAYSSFAIASETGTVELHKLKTEGQHSTYSL